jgi:hypothetical protein
MNTPVVDHPVAGVAAAEWAERAERAAGNRLEKREEAAVQTPDSVALPVQSRVAPARSLKVRGRGLLKPEVLLASRGTLLPGCSRTLCRKSCRVFEDPAAVAGRQEWDRPEQLPGQKCRCRRKKI